MLRAEVSIPHSLAQKGGFVPHPYRSYSLGETSLISPEVWLFLQTPPNIQKVSLIPLNFNRSQFGPIRIN
jgi:hypothetical protein